jgi:hypothetical protein
MQVRRNEQDHPLRQLILLLQCYTWNDPSGELPEELFLSGSPPGILAYDEAGFSKLYAWSNILAMSGETSPSGDPDDMDMLTITFTGGCGCLVIECEDYATLLQSLNKSRIDPAKAAADKKEKERKRILKMNQKISARKKAQDDCLAEAAAQEEKRKAEQEAQRVAAAKEEELEKMRQELEQIKQKEEAERKTEEAEARAIIVANAKKKSGIKRGKGKGKGKGKGGADLEKTISGRKKTGKGNGKVVQKPALDREMSARTQQMISQLMLMDADSGGGNIFAELPPLNLLNS